MFEDMDDNILLKMSRGCRNFWRGQKSHLIHKGLLISSFAVQPSERPLVCLCCRLFMICMSFKKKTASLLTHDYREKAQHKAVWTFAKQKKTHSLVYIECMYLCISRDAYIHVYDIQLVNTDRLSCSREIIAHLARNSNTDYYPKPIIRVLTYWR